MRRASLILIAAACVALSVGGAAALTIYDIQFSTPPNYDSPYNGQVVSVTGGIVTKVFVGGSTKITMQDPTLGDAWAGIQVVFGNPGQAAGIQRGDRIDLFDVTVGEFRGNTQLNFGAASTVVIQSSGHVVEPLIVSPADIPSPSNPDLSEPYEFMLLAVENVTVGAMDLGKNEDNYELFNGEGVCWASDYANSDLPPGGIYFVAPPDCFARVVGYLEQYRRPEQGWDYYQLLPRDAADYIFAPSPAQAGSWGAVKTLFR